MRTLKEKDPPTHHLPLRPSADVELMRVVMKGESPCVTGNLDKFRGKGGTGLETWWLMIGMTLQGPTPLAPHPARHEVPEGLPLDPSISPTCTYGVESTP